MRRTAVVLLFVVSLSVGMAFSQEPETAYSQTNLVSDLPRVAAHIDRQLINPWGLAFFPGTSASNPSSPVWVSDNNSGFSTLYDPAGVKQGLIVTIPPPTGSTATATPTGIVANTSKSNFPVQGFPSTAFIFDTEDGNISGWGGGTMAVLAVDNSAKNAVYKGLALIHNSSGDFLLAANFHSGAIEVYNQNFKLVTLAGGFHDPALPAGYAPFAVHLVNGNVFVAYARQNSLKHDPVIGPGRGFVSEFDINGHFMRRFASRGVLDAPWGLVQAPAIGFGRFNGKLLIGNFGDGIINVFDPDTMTLLGQIANPDGTIIHNPGLWDMAFGADAAHPNVLYFTSGILSEAHGLFGTIKVVPDE